MVRFLGICFLFLSSCSFRETAWDLANNPRVEGKFQDKKCLVYAKSLSKEFKDRRIDSRIVFIKQINKSRIYYHAIIVYVEDGQFYVVDNFYGPIWTKSDCWEQAVYEFSRYFPGRIVIDKIAEN